MWLPLFLALVAQPAASGNCGDLSKLRLTNATISLVTDVAAGGFTSPNAGRGESFGNLPAFCRVAATLKPSNDSDIKIEVWLPAGGWNGKLMSVGNGAFSGSIAYAAMATALARGYAASSTDTGHSGGSAQFGLGHSEKVIDFGWRAVHELAEASKKIVTAYYSAPPKHAYWNGCSAGGRQAMKEAQRFPADFDGIIAGAPGLDWTGRASQAVRLSSVLERNPAARLLRSDRELLHRAVVGACDALDGVKDGLIQDPSACTYDPVALQCTGAAQSGCLSADQVATARLMYASTIARGSELGWTDNGWTGSAQATGLDQFRYLVYQDPAWTISKFNFDTDHARAEQADRDTINALDPNLKPFFDRGGKLLQYHGWSDPQISPFNSTRYYDRVVERLGVAAVHNSYRLFMAPGMGHCSGGEGPNDFDEIAALEQWVEQGKAPDQMVASHASNGVIDRTRPLCPFPQMARYLGKGDINEAASFTCGPQPREPDGYRPDEVRISLERTICFGDCPIYTVTVTGDGTVRYNGVRFVGVTGEKEAKIAPDQVARLATAFLQAHFLESADTYSGSDMLVYRDGQFLRLTQSITDVPSQVLTLELGARKKRIVLRYQFPAELGKLADLVDEITQSKQWTAVRKD